MKKKAFISGPIQGMETKQYYRKVVSEICKNCGLEPVDPWEREKILYRGTESDWWVNVPAKDFVKRDLEDIENCEVLIAYLPNFPQALVWSFSTLNSKVRKPYAYANLRIQAHG